MEVIEDKQSTQCRQLSSESPSESSWEKSNPERYDKVAPHLPKLAQFIFIISRLCHDSRSIGFMFSQPRQAIHLVKTVASCCLISHHSTSDLE